MNSSHVWQVEFFVGLNIKEDVPSLSQGSRQQQQAEKWWRKVIELKMVGGKKKGGKNSPSFCCIRSWTIVFLRSGIGKQHNNVLIWLMLINEALYVGPHITVWISIWSCPVCLHLYSAWIFILYVCNKLSYQLPLWSLSPVDEYLVPFFLIKSGTQISLNVFIKIYANLLCKVNLTPCYSAPYL